MTKITVKLSILYFITYKFKNLMETIIKLAQITYYMDFIKGIQEAIREGRLLDFHKTHCSHPNGLEPEGFAHRLTNWG